MEKTEQIGKVNLDLTYYSGVDSYCDGEVEDDLLEIVRDHAEEEYPRLIEEHRSWEALYHLSAQRENIVEWLPMDEGMKVLEIGAGCGAITGVIAKKAGSVTCVDLSRKRSMINAHRHRDCGNIEIHVGNFMDIEPSLPTDYDYVLFIGVFEYAKAYIGGDQPFEDFLKIAGRHLKKDGRIVIAIENKFGLKYWAGCGEDHLGSFFSGIEGYPDGGPARTFTRNGLEAIFKNCGFKEYAFYYPYPDYKFMVSLYSDDYLPKPGELANNIRNFDRDRLLLFDERKAFDNILREGLFPLYANSYLVVLGEKPNTCYAKYSNDRKAAYRIRTEIVPVALPWPEGGDEAAEGEERGLKKQLAVRKYPLCPEAKEHIRNIEAAYRKLKDRYAGGELKINRAKLVEQEGEAPYIELEYIEGVTLEEMFDRCLERDDREGFLALFRKYFAMVDYRSDMAVADFDLIFSNILLSAKDETKPFDAVANSIWTLIDYEWTFGRQIDTRVLAFRALQCYQWEDAKRRGMDMGALLRELKMGEAEAEAHRAQEKEFQLFVTGGRYSMAQMWTTMGHRCYNAKELIDLVEKRIRDEIRALPARIEIFELRETEYNAEEAVFADQCGALAEDDEGFLHLTWKTAPGVLRVRIDPAMTDCIVWLKEARWNGRELVCHGADSVLETNGTALEGGDSFLFATEDPQLVFHVQGQAFEAENVLEVCMKRCLIGRKIAQDMENTLKRGETYEKLYKEGSAERFSQAQEHAPQKAVSGAGAALRRLVR